MNTSHGIRSAHTFTICDPNTAPLAFSPDGKQLFVLDARDTDTNQLVALDTQTGEIVDTYAHDPYHDLGKFMMHTVQREASICYRDTDSIQAVYIQQAKQDWLCFDANIRQTLTYTRNHLGDGNIDIISRDTSDNRWVISYSCADQPLRYYLITRTTGSIEPLSSESASTNTKQQTLTQSFFFPTRDGFTLHGYMTYVTGSQQPMPTIALVHGGPAVRDTYTYDPLTIWLAQCGYLVLRITYRGSIGYGRSLCEAGTPFFTYPDALYDIVDGVTSAEEAGYADQHRVAIIGHSQGGYIAACAGTLAPDTFRCAVSISGMSDLFATARQHIPQEHADALINNYYDALYRGSPYYMALHMQIPMFIAHGEQDQQVPVSHSTGLMHELARYNLQHESCIFPNEKHCIANIDNYTHVLSRIQRFLAREMQ